MILRKSILASLAIVIALAGISTVSAQFPIKVPKLPKVEKPKESPTTAPTDPESKQTSSAGTERPSTGNRSGGGKVVYPAFHPDDTVKIDKDSIYVQAKTEKEYWKAKGQRDYHSWAPMIRFNVFCKPDRDINFNAEYYNQDGSLWFTEQLEWGIKAADRTFAAKSDISNTSQIIETKGSIATGAFGFKIKDRATGELYYEGKFKVAKQQTPYYSKNQWDFYVDHDWEMPIGTVSFHFSDFNGVEDNGGFQPIVSMWFKGNMGNSDHGLEARLFYKGQQIATTAGNSANIGKDSNGGGERATEQCVLNANLCHWQRFTFQWPNVRVDNGGTFNRDYYPNATYIDKNPGEYVVKVFKNGGQVREATFTVSADGRVADGGYHRPGHLLYYKVLIPVKVIGTSEKYNPLAWKTDAFYGNPMSGFVVN